MMLTNDADDADRGFKRLLGWAVFSCRESPPPGKGEKGKEEKEREEKEEREREGGRGREKEEREQDLTKVPSIYQTAGSPSNSEPADCISPPRSRRPRDAQYTKQTHRY